ncbi:hypothetical protein GCM10007862_07140 [Dyella lipolytica]|nr:hypothetical protein GCM10007862_07140 [Dyella lipolytica]
MDVVGNLTGCSLSFGVGGNSATISCTSGNVHFANGSVVAIIPSSITVTLGVKARRVRVYVAGIRPPTPIQSSAGLPTVYLGNGEHGLIGVDEDQNTPRGVYPAGLVVIGHVDLPAEASTQAVTSDVDLALGSRERTSMLRIIRALTELAKLKERGSAVPIERQIQELGFDGPKESTIRDVLREARDLDPNR